MKRTLLFLFYFGAAILLAGLPAFAQDTPEAEPVSLKRIPGMGVPQGIVVRTSENVTKGGWVWLLNQCETLGIRRIDLLVKQDEDNYASARTRQTLQSGDLLVPLPGEKCAPGWEDASWLREMLAKAKEKNIEVWAWWPCFHDAAAAALFPNAAYSSKRGEHFVDPAVFGVRERQAVLLKKLLENYEFDGVSLDWVRYEGWYAGSKGPLGAQFARSYNFQWQPNALTDEYLKARWYEMRARLLADWVRELVIDLRVSHPCIRWGAFLLPSHFTEDSQNYPMFGHAGLDYLQPMGYWTDWKLTPEWVGDTLLSQHRQFAPGTGQWLALGIDSPADEIQRALKNIPAGLTAGASWFTFGSWEQSSFDKLRKLLQESAPARRYFGLERPPALDLKEPPPVPPAPSISVISHRALKLKEFSAEGTVWALVCQAELYKRHALDGETVAVPILAFHTFAEGAPGSQSYLYKCSTGYLDQLLNFIADHGFTVCPLSRFQSYLITGDRSFLPPKPLILTLDDGSESVYNHFFPRMKARKWPFSIAVVTSWLSTTDKSNHSTEERDHTDATMTWKEAKEMYQSGLVEITSHSDAMHYQAAETPAADEQAPALLTRQYLVEFQRTETNEEYARRVWLDMFTSRQRIALHGFRPPTIFCWPYGLGNRTAQALGEQAGFTHFLLYDTPDFATAEDSTDGIPRIPVLRTDESAPLRFPVEPLEAQGWWLAFLRLGCESCSPGLIRATLAQLTPENQRHPEARVAHAVLDYLRGDTASGSQRLLLLRQAYPFTPDVAESVAKALKQFNAAPQ